MTMVQLIVGISFTSCGTTANICISYEQTRYCYVLPDWTVVLVD